MITNTWIDELNRAVDKTNAQPFMHSMNQTDVKIRWKTQWNKSNMSLNR